MVRGVVWGIVTALDPPIGLRWRRRQRAAPRAGRRSRPYKSSVRSKVLPPGPKFALHPRAFSELSAEPSRFTAGTPGRFLYLELTSSGDRSWSRTFWRNSSPSLPWSARPTPRSSAGSPIIAARMGRGSRSCPAPRATAPISSPRSARQTREAMCSRVTRMSCRPAKRAGAPIRSRCAPRASVSTGAARRI